MFMMSLQQLSTDMSIALVLNQPLVLIFGCLVHYSTHCLAHDLTCESLKSWVNDAEWV